MLCSPSVEEALWWQLYLVSGSHGGSIVVVVVVRCLLPVHLCNSLFDGVRETERRLKDMIIFNTSDRLQNKSGNIIEPLIPVTPPPLRSFSVIGQQRAVLSICVRRTWLSLLAADYVEAAASSCIASGSGSVVTA